MTTALVLLIVFVILQVLDFYTTKTILGAGGVELNPVARWLIARLGVNEALVLAKGVAIAGGVVIYLYATSELILLALDVLYVGVIVFNQRSMP